LLDDATGLTRFGVRDYDNESGRWTAQDPIGFAGGSSNPYEYVAGSPITTADPDGRFILAIVGGVITYIAERGAGAAPIAALERALISTAVGIVIPFGSAAVLERLIAGGVSSGILNQLFRILLDPCDSIASNTSFSRLVDGAVLGGALAGFGAGIASIGRLAASTRGVYLGQSAFRVLDRLAEFTALNSEGALTAAGIPRRVGHDR
jgi:RHS repeat-associated protein